MANASPSTQHIAAAGKRLANAVALGEKTVAAERTILKLAESRLEAVARDIATLRPRVHISPDAGTRYQALILERGQLVTVIAQAQKILGSASESANSQPISPTTLRSTQVDYLSFPGFFKARPAEEGGKRFVYMEASNEARDFQGERVISEALAESADYYARYGNLDLDHISQIGQRQGIPDHYLYEIGRPVEVKVRNGKTWVKGAIYAGEGRTAAHANDFWDSLTKLKPAKQWYPSVGGAVLDKGPEINSAGGSDTVVRKVRWTNIGFSQTPVNPDVPTVGIVPFGALAKAWGASGLNLSKALEAGYGTDSAALAGGGALRRQDIDPEIQNYWDFRDRLAGDVRAKRTTGTAADIVAHDELEQQMTGCGLERQIAAFVAAVADQVRLAPPAVAEQVSVRLMEG